MRKVPPSTSIVLTEIPKNDIEEDSIASYAIENIAATAKPDLSNGKDPANLELIAEPKTKGSFKCFYCNEYFYSNDERRNHRGQYHPDKPLGYPTQEDFDNRLER